MSKQVYIDENGNEIQVSGTVNTADMMPMSGNDSTKVSEAIGDLSTLTTTDKSSIVGAINEIATYTPVYGNTASGAIATFDTSLALPLQDCTIEINAVQEEGTPTPSSPKAISGFTGANIKVQSRNWIPLTVSSIKSANQLFTWSDNVGTYHGLTVTLLTDDGITINGIKVNGTANASTNIMTPTFEVQGSYIFNGCVSGGTTSTYYMACRVNNAWATNARDFGNGVTINGTITQSAITIANGAQIKNLVFKPMLRVSTDTDSTYTPYTATTTAISWQSEAGTVYGGSLDVTTGKLTVVNGSMGAGEYQIAPIPINQLSGTNNIFCDTGNTSVVYACSLKDYIDSQ